MNPKFEAEEVKVFGEMYKKGYIYKGKKPVYWCPHDETALAEAEIEYSEDPCKSIYVKFKVKDDHGKLAQYCDLDNLYFLIWTTTTWTIPGNLAICLNADFDYVLAKPPTARFTSSPRASWSASPRLAASTTSRCSPSSRAASLSL